MMKSPVATYDITRYEKSLRESSKDLVVSEEPLEIRVKFNDGLDYREKRLAVTMRTPGHDFELGVGFLISEGIIQSYDDIERIFYCEEIKSEEEAGNVIVIQLRKEMPVPESVFNRNFFINSSCGVCGKSSIESIEVVCQRKFSNLLPRFRADLIAEIPDKISGNQTVFRHTGGLHASALFDKNGNLGIIREDIGRHNALDKLIGARAIEHLSNEELMLFVSGRAGFELVQKAIVAGIPVMVSVGAPSSLAVDLARGYGMTLIGFARNDRFNVYSGEERLDF